MSRTDSSETVPKGWGHEIIFANNPMYCGKILHFDADKKCSMHFHLNKDETWYVASGRFRMRWIDTDHATQHETILKPGMVVRNRPGEPHQLEALEAGDIFEVSTTHEDADSYRVAPGNSQQ